MNHFNIANIWGILDDYKQKTTDNGKPFLEVFISCSHAEYGNVRILGWIWGKSQVGKFTSRFKRGDEVRLGGNMQQYEGRGGAVRSTFNLYKFNPGPIKERKAAFIMAGEVVSLKDEALKILIAQKNNNGSIKNKERFEVKVPKDILLDCEASPEAGKLVKLKGYIIQEEDEFGGTIGPQCPVVKKLEVLNNNETQQP